MSTNFYAHWRPPGSDHVSIGLHVGKSGGPHEWTFNGEVFRRWESWKEFLIHNAERIALVDETQDTWEPEEFARHVEQTRPPRRGLVPFPPRTWHAGREWVDEDGYHFYAGEFS
jgi:hypothetical protein